MTRFSSLLAFAALSVLGTSVRADVLELKNGVLLSGKYAGGTATTIRLDTSAGLQVIETSQVIALTFTAPPASLAPPAAPVPEPAPVPQSPPAATPSKVTLPVGTLLLVRMRDSVSSKNAPGTNFTTKLEYDLVVDGVLAAKAGTVIYGKVQSSSQARRAVGRSTLDVRLSQMVPQGSPIPIASSGYKQAGEASIKKVAGAAAVGAVIGNNTGSGDASAGALWGAGISMLKPGQTLTIPPGALLEFTLTQPVTVPAIR